MRLQYHIAISVVVAGALWALTRSFALAASSLCAGILVDLDHFVDYYAQYGFKFSLRRFFRASYRGEYDRAFVLLHAWEWLALALVCAWWFRGHAWVVGLAIGWTHHMILDQIVNTSNAVCYFILYRWRQGFDYLTAFPMREEVEQPWRLWI
jgi:hypothetical protein